MSDYGETRGPRPIMAVWDIVNTHFEGKVKTLKKSDGDIVTVWWNVVREYPLYLLVDNGLYRTCIDKWSLISGF